MLYTYTYIYIYIHKYYTYIYITHTYIYIYIYTDPLAVTTYLIPNSFEFLKILLMKLSNSLFSTLFLEKKEPSEFKTKFLVTGI